MKSIGTARPWCSIWKKLCWALVPGSPKTISPLSKSSGEPSRVTRLPTTKHQQMMMHQSNIHFEESGEVISLKVPPRHSRFCYCAEGGGTSSCSLAHNELMSVSVELWCGAYTLLIKPNYCPIGNIRKKVNLTYQTGKFLVPLQNADVFDYKYEKTLISKS